MQAAIPMGPLEMLVIMLFGGGFGLSTGMPPGPENPQMASVAPPECLYYTSWAGTVQPDPDSSNATEQLLAESAVKAFLTRSRVVRDFQPWPRFEAWTKQAV